MRQNRYLKYFILQILNVLAVILIFKLIEDRRLAAFIAGLLFILVSAICMFWEYKSAEFQSKIFWAAGLQFVVLFCLPIFLLRVLNWEMDFTQIEFMGIRPTLLHKYSNFSYMLWMAVCAFKGAAQYSHSKKK